MSGYPLSQLIELATWILAAGALVGVLAGLFGIGGGAVIVPVLYEVFRVLEVPEALRMQLAIGTSIAIIAPTTFRSYVNHKRRGAVIPGVVVPWGAAAVVGVLIGSVVAAFAPSAVFKIAFVIFATLISLRMFLGTDRWSLGTELPGRGPMTIYGMMTGLISSLVGVSGGAFSNTIMTLYGQPIHRAVATSSGIGVPITVAGAIGYMIAGWHYRDMLPPLSVGFVSLIGFALMAPVASWTTSYGVRLAHWLPHRVLEIGFGLFLGSAGVRFLVSLIN